MRIVVVLVTAVFLSGCGSATPQAAPHQRDRAGNDGPPPITLLTTPAVDLAPGSSCWTENGSGRCVDMATVPTSRLPVVRSDQVRLRFEVDDTTFHASLAPAQQGSGCRRVYPGRISDEGTYDHVLTSSAPAGRYRVSLVGHADAGDVVGEFVWSTSTNGVPVPPTADVSIVWKPHGKLKGQGFHLNINGVPARPHTASATITGTAANGRSHTFDAGKARLGCDSVSFYEMGKPEESQRVAALGPAPFTYDVVLQLDGTEYSASAVWPDDHVDTPGSDNPAPVPLHFEPPLPGG